MEQVHATRKGQTEPSTPKTTEEAFFEAIHSAPCFFGGRVMGHHCDKKEKESLFGEDGEFKDPATVHTILVKNQ